MSFFSFDTSTDNTFISFILTTHSYELKVWTAGLAGSSWFIRPHGMVRSADPFKYTSPSFIPSQPIFTKPNPLITADGQCPLSSFHHSRAVWLPTHHLSIQILVYHGNPSQLAVDLFEIFHMSCSPIFLHAIISATLSGPLCMSTYFKN